MKSIGILLTGCVLIFIYFVTLSFNTFTYKKFNFVRNMLKELDSQFLEVIIVWVGYADIMRIE